MPNGQTLGPKRYFGYDSDSGTQYSLLLDETLGLAGGLTLDDTKPPAPRRFKPRGVYVEAIVNGTKARKFIICDPTSPLYDADASTNVTIDTIVFASTGRRGEKLSFGSNP